MVEADGTSRLGINTGGIDVMEMDIKWGAKLIRKYTPLFDLLGYEGPYTLQYGAVKCTPFSYEGSITSICAESDGVCIAKHSMQQISLDEADVLYALLTGKEL